MKYIMFEQMMDGYVIKMPIIFPDRLIHKDMAEAVKQMLKRADIHVEVVSAGEVVLASCYNVRGKSETLGVEAKLEDRDTINCYDYLHGIVGFPEETKA